MRLNFSLNETKQKSHQQMCMHDALTLYIIKFFFHLFLWYLFSIYLNIYVNLSNEVKLTAFTYQKHDNN